MAERKRIGVPISGLDTSTPDHSVVDGKCANLHNLRYTGGAWRNVKPFMASPKLPNLGGKKIVYHHPADGDNAYITYSEETTEGVTSYTFYRSEYGDIYGEWRWSHSEKLCTVKDAHSHSVEEVFQIGHFGKMLIIGNHITKSFDFFFLTTNDFGGLSYEQVEFSNIDIDLSLQIPRSTADRRTLTTSIPESATSAECIVRSTTGEFIFDSKLQDNDFNGEYKHFRGEFVIVAALVSEEGEIIKMSPMRLFNSAMEVRKTYPNTEREYAYKCLDEAKVTEILKAKYYESDSDRFNYWPGEFFFCEADATLTCKGIVSGTRAAYVDLYATRLYNLLEYRGCRDWGENTINLFNEPFYRFLRKGISELTFNEEKNEYTWDFTVDSHTFNNIEQGDELEVVQTADDIYGNIALEYNNRLHLTGVCTKLNYDDLSDYLKTGRGGYSNIVARINYDAEKYWYSKTFENDNTLLLDDSYIFALKGNVSTLYLADGSNVKKYSLRHSALYNLSFAYKYDSIIENDDTHYAVALEFAEAMANGIRLADTKYRLLSDWGEAATIPQIAPNRYATEIYTPNSIRVSSINIPYSYPYINSYRVAPGTSSIIAVNSGAIELSDDKFGEFPLYVFTTEGIYAMQSGTETVYTNIVPSPYGTYDVIINPNTLAVNGAVLYFADKGLHALTSQGAQLLSAPLHTSNNRIPAWMYTTQMVYLPEWNELLCTDLTNNKAYVFSLDSRVWSTRDIPEGYIINNDELITTDHILNLRNEVETLSNETVYPNIADAPTKFSLTRNSTIYQWRSDWGVLKRSDDGISDEDRKVSFYNSANGLNNPKVYIYRPSQPGVSLKEYKFYSTVRAKLEADFNPKNLTFLIDTLPNVPDDDWSDVKYVYVYTPDGCLFTTLEYVGNNQYYDTIREDYNNQLFFDTDNIQLIENNVWRVFPMEDAPLDDWWSTHYGDDDSAFYMKTLYFDVDDSSLYYAFFSPLDNESSGIEPDMVVCKYDNGVYEAAYECFSDSEDPLWEDRIYIEEVEGGDNEGGDNEGGDNEGGDNEGGDNEGGGNEGGGNEGGGNETYSPTHITLSTRPIKLGSMELKRAETIIVRFECATEQTLNVKVEGSVDTQHWPTLRELKDVKTNKDIIIRRTPCSVKYLRFIIRGDVTDDIRILAFEVEYYNRMRHRMR